MSTPTSALAPTTPQTKAKADKVLLLNIDELYSLHNMRFSAVTEPQWDHDRETQVHLRGKGVILVDGRFGGAWSVKQTFAVEADKDAYGGVETVIEDTYEDSIDTAIKKVESSSTDSWKIVLLPPEVKHVTINDNDSNDFLDNETRTSVVLNLYGEEKVVSKAVSDAIERFESENGHTVGLLNHWAGTYRSYCNCAGKYLSSTYVTLIVEHFLDFPTHNYAGLWHDVDGDEWNTQRCLRLSTYPTVYEREIEYSVSATGDDILVEGVHYAAANYWGRDSDAGRNAFAWVRKDLENTEGTLVMVGPLENLGRARALASQINAKEVKVYEHADVTPKETTLVAELSTSISRSHSWILQENVSDSGNTYLILYRKQVNKMGFDGGRRKVGLDTKKRKEGVEKKGVGVKGNITLIDLQRNELVTMSLGEAVEAGYTTWSHTWDRESNLENGSWHLGNETEISSQRPIEFNSVEKTKNMLSISRSLGIRYTWMDYVCILQTGEGSAEDKERSVPMMGEYYRLSRTTFVYVDAVPYDLPREIFQRQYMVSQAVKNSKWRTRIWTFQEEAVSSDLVIVGKRHLIFDYQSDLQDTREGSSPYNFNSIMTMARTRDCTLPQDYVYGTLSLLPYGKELKIDYSRGLSGCLVNLSLEAGKARDYSFLINRGKVLQGDEGKVVHYLSHPRDFSSVDNLSNKYDGRLAVENAADACGLSLNHGVENHMASVIGRGARTSEMSRRMFTLFSTKAGKETGDIKPGDFPPFYQSYAGDPPAEEMNLFFSGSRISMTTMVSPDFHFLSSSLDSFHDRMKDAIATIIDVEGEKFDAPWYWYAMTGKFTEKWPFGEPSRIIEDDDHAYYCFTHDGANLTGAVKLVQCDLYLHGTLPVYLMCTLDSEVCHRVGYAICMYAKEGRNPHYKPNQLGPALCTGMYHPHRYWTQRTIVLG